MNFENCAFNVRHDHKNDGDRTCISQQSELKKSRLDNFSNTISSAISTLRECNTKVILALLLLEKNAFVMYSSTRSTVL